MLMTGMHTVCDIFCNRHVFSRFFPLLLLLHLSPLSSPFFHARPNNRCNAQLGWTYIAAFEESQKYKVGKFIIEKANMMRDSDWCTARNGV